MSNCYVKLIIFSRQCSSSTHLSGAVESHFNYESDHICVFLCFDYGYAYYNLRFEIFNNGNFLFHIFQ